MNEANEMREVILITGASSGIGLVTANALAEEGYLLFGTSRKTAYPQDVNRDGVTMIPMDVTDPASIREAVAFVLREAGRLDVLINNAGYGIAGAIEQTSFEEAQQQLLVNFLGVHSVVREVVTPMREAGRGLILNMGSVAGQIGLPFQAFYTASKFALQGYSEALRHELRPFGIRVYLLVPGDFETAFTANRIITAEAAKGGVYSEVFQRCLGVVEGDEEDGADPILIARAVSRIIKRKPRRFQIPVGPAYEKAALLVRRFLPYTWFERILRLYYKLG